MYAIVDIKGVQYKVSENTNLFVPKLKEEAGAKVTFDKVLLFSPDDKTFEIGAPVLKKTVSATVLETVKDDKVTVFKKKRRKGYRVTRGHRQQYTKVSIDSIK